MKKDDSICVVVIDAACLTSMMRLSPIVAKIGLRIVQEAIPPPFGVIERVETT